MRYFLFAFFLFISSTAYAGSGDYDYYCSGTSYWSTVCEQSYTCNQPGSPVGYWSSNSGGAPVPHTSVHYCGIPHNEIGGCSNGVKDGDETGTDCGGSCSPCDPGGGGGGCAVIHHWYMNADTQLYGCYDATGVSYPGCTAASPMPLLPDAACSGTIPPGPTLTFLLTNGLKDFNEDGVDCGGVNPAPCVQKCPSGYVPDSNYTNLQHVILFGFWSAGDYSNDPEACVKLDPYNPSLLGPADCDKTWLTYEVDGQKKTLCGDLRKTYPSADVAPPLTPSVVDIVYPADPSGAITPGGQLKPDTNTAPTSPDLPNAQKCTNKTMTDGSVCTVCTSPGGGGSVNCVGPNGATTTASTPTTRTPIVDGCNQITYGNGTTCTVCIDPVTKQQTVTCKDGAQATVDPTTVPSAVGDGLLGSIDKKVGDVRGQLQDVGTGIDGIYQSAKTSTALQQQANGYLKTISEKSFTSSGTTTVNTTGIENRLTDSNNYLSDIKNGVTTMTAATTPNQAAVVEQLDSSGDAALAPMEATLQSGITQIQADFQPSHMPVNEGISGKLRSVLPTSGTCQDLTITVFTGHQTVIPCAPFERFKSLFFWLLNCWTVMHIYEILFSSAPKRT